MRWSWHGLLERKTGAVRKPCTIVVTPRVVTISGSTSRCMLKLGETKIEESTKTALRSQRYVPVRDEQKKHSRATNNPKQPKTNPQAGRRDCEGFPLKKIFLPEASMTWIAHPRFQLPARRMEKYLHLSTLYSVVASGRLTLHGQTLKQLPIYRPSCGCCKSGIRSTEGKDRLAILDGSLTMGLRGYVMALLPGRTTAGR